MVITMYVSDSSDDINSVVDKIYMVDVIIRNGRMIDPANDVDQVQDIAIKDGRIFAIAKNIQLNSRSEYDATGCLVTPGLIDAHVHCYEHVTPLGINPDETCLSRGCTTVIDAGSAGASTFLGMKKYIVAGSKTRVHCLLHIALHGLASAGCAGGEKGKNVFGESDTLSVLDVDACRKCVESNRDVIVGVKVRLAEGVCAGGANEAEAYRRSLSVSRATGLPLMVHHARSTIPTQRSEDTPSNLCCPGDLKPGDIYTHTFTGKVSSIVDPAAHTIWPDVLDAKRRGVYFDAGHGQGSFSWTVAEICAKEKFWPDLLGTDIHSGNKSGPVYDLPTVMSKFLHIGMPLTEIIRSVTSTPARAYSLDDEIGSLQVGKTADVTVLRLQDCDVHMEDTSGQLRNMKCRLVPLAVWRAGERYQISDPDKWPSESSREKMLKERNDPQLIISDAF